MQPTLWYAIHVRVQELSGVFLGDSVTVSILWFPVWIHSSYGEIAGESGGFWLVGDCITTSLRFGCAITRILS